MRDGNGERVNAAELVLDVGGEGRYAEAWNLNPSRVRTFGPRRGEPIARLIHARGDAIPLADGSVDVVIVERTPLLPATIRELLRVARPRARFVLRHVETPGGDPHRLVLSLINGKAQRGWTTIGSHRVRETTIQREPGPGDGTS